MDGKGQAPALHVANPVSRGLARALASALGMTALASPFAATAAGTYIVNTTGDPGPLGSLSLRQAIAAADASDGNTVQFAASLAHSTITLTTGNIPISSAISIVGPGADNITISGGNASRIFHPSCSTNKLVSISGLTLSDGNAGAQNGGAILSLGCKLSLSDVHITNSHARSGGGVVFDSGTISNSVISGCHADNSGGAIAVYGGTGNRYINTSTIESNTAVKGGGGVFVDDVNFGNSSAFARISQSTINNNHVTATVEPLYGGGGIAVVHSKLELYYSTVTQNQSYSKGGGVTFADTYSANLGDILRATVVHNSAFKTGGNGIYAPGATVFLDSSIVADNFSIYGLSDLAGSALVIYSLIQSPNGNTVTGEGALVGADPNLAPLDDNGGPTKTMLPNPGSPVIDAVNFCFNKDQRGLNCVNGKADMGSVERQNPEVIIFRDGFDSG